MEKRYKQKSNKNKKTIVVIIAIIIVIIIVFFLINNKGKKTIINNTLTESINEALEYDNNEVEEKNNNIKLSSNLIVPEELNKEMLSNIGQDAELIKIQYKLINLEDGEIELFYKDEGKIIKIEVNIKEKSIVNMTEIEDDELIKKSKIQDNIKENIENYYEENKELLNDEKVLNIIITDTEVIMNISYI